VFGTQMKGLSRVEKRVYFIVGFLILAFLAGLVEVQLFVAGKGRLDPIFKIFSNIHAYLIAILTGRIIRYL
jgi:hypothetical protein